MLLQFIVFAHWFLCYFHSHKNLTKHYFMHVPWQFCNYMKWFLFLRWTGKPCVCGCVCVFQTMPSAAMSPWGDTSLLQTIKLSSSRCRLPPARQTMHTPQPHTHIYAHTHAHTHAQGAQVTVSRHCNRKGEVQIPLCLTGEAGDLYHNTATSCPNLSSLSSPSKHLIAPSHPSVSSLRLPRGPWQTPLLWQEVLFFSLTHR